MEVIGSLSVLVSKKADYGPALHTYMAKAIAWWFALCGKVGVKSVSRMLWGKFPTYVYTATANLMTSMIAQLERPSLVDRIGLNLHASVNG